MTTKEHALFRAARRALEEGDDDGAAAMVRALAQEFPRGARARDRARLTDEMALRRGAANPRR